MSIAMTRNEVDMTLSNLKDVQPNGILLEKPMTPSVWLDDEPDVCPILRIQMTAGGGMGGSLWYEFIKGFTLEELLFRAAEGKPILAETWNGKKVVLNLNYMVKADKLTLVQRTLDSRNANFKIGQYDCYWLFPENTVDVTFRGE